MEGPVKKVKPVIPGLTLVSDFITEEEEATLLARVNESEWNTSLQRRTQHYGYLYNYASREAAEPAPPIPEWANFLIDRLIEQKLLHVRPDQLIVNEYAQGQGIGAHIDHVKFFADGIVSISLGDEMIMSFSKQGEEKVELPLPRKSALILFGDARWKWRHAIDGKQKHAGTRVSLTFRKMK